MNEFKFFFNKLPFNIILYPTSRCNASCPHCYNTKRSVNLKDSELTLDEITKISQNFKHIKVLTISGGEPFLRNDIKEIAAIFFKNNGLQYLSIHTNGFLTEEISAAVLDILNSLKSVKLIICISIDAIGEKHNNLRGVKNGFDKILKTINELKKIKKKKSNLFLVSSAIFSKSTEDSVEDTVAYIQQNINEIKPSLSLIRGDAYDSEEKKIDINKYINFHQNQSVIKDKSIKLFSLMSLKDAIESLTHKYVVKNFINQKQTLSCKAGEKLVVIYENGDVYPCESYNEKFGNLREADYDIKKLLFSDKAKKILNDISAKKCFCTWENIIPINLIFDVTKYPLILYKWLALNLQLLKNNFC